MTNQEILKITMAQSAVLLSHLAQSRICPQRHQKRFSSRVDGNDGEALRDGRRDESIRI